MPQIHPHFSTKTLLKESTPPDEAVLIDDVLSLDTEIRFHAASELHGFIAGILATTSSATLAAIASSLERSGYHLRITRSLQQAKDYLRERYAEHTSARFGILASSRDKDLVHHGVDNDYQSTKRFRLGPWYGDDEHAYGDLSCRRLTSCVTEFGSQGLELDAALVAWGTDLLLRDGNSSIERARKYMVKRGQHASVQNASQLRLNAYRVLLTRGRDVNVVFVPPLPELDETFNYLVASGFRELR
ncbi:MAG: DNA/RNA helicase domain-containing protein [Gemmatimonadaceae bacterium]